MNCTSPYLFLSYVIITIIWGIAANRGLITVQMAVDNKGRLYLLQKRNLLPECSETSNFCATCVKKIRQGRKNYAYLIQYKEKIVAINKSSAPNSGVAIKLNRPWPTVGKVKRNFKETIVCILGGSEQNHVSHLME